MAKQSVKKKQRKESTHHKKLSRIIIAVLMVALPILGKAIFDNHQTIQMHFDTLATDVHNTADADEALYIDCQARSRDTTIIMNDIKSLRLQLMNVTNQHALLGRLVSLKTYCMIHKFTSWSNQLQSDVMHACETVRPSQNIANERNAVLDQIYQNKIQRRGMWSSFIEYFTRARDKKYKPEDCL